MTDQVTLTIDGREVTVPPGTLVLDAAAALNIEIPIFCSHPKLDPVACCRMCMVEIEGPRGPMLQTACSVPVAQGMVVRTDTQPVKDMQEANLAFILLNHPLDCPICDKGGECPLQDQTIRFGPGISELVDAKRHKKKHYNISDTIVLDQERCVVCWRCIRYLEEWEDKPQLGLFERGGATLIDIQPGQPVDAKTGGNIIDICPVGALTNRVARFAYRPWQIERTPSIDPHFSLGDNIRIDTRTYKIRRIVGRENMAVNDQWIADKTRFAYEWVNSEERLTMPMVRENGSLRPATWSEALRRAADGLSAAVRRHGPDAVGAIGSAKLGNESNYLLQRFVRQVIGSNNIDHRDGAEVAALATGLPALADIMKPQYGPDPKVDTIFIFGLDPSEELPMLDVHLKRAVRRGKAKLIIAHPRQIELTRYPGPHMHYLPGSEVTLLNALARLTLDAKGDVDRETAKLLPGVKDRALADAGVDPAAVRQAAEMLAASSSALIMYGPMAARGPHGAAVRQALVNLALAGGHYERLAYVGLEANSQGCRDMGVLSDRLPGHVPLDDDAVRARLEKLWGARLPTQPGKSYGEMLDGAGGPVKALYIMGANPASEKPRWADNLDKLDFLVVQELFLTETAQLADVVLPAVSWAESDSTFTSAERRVQRAPKALSNPDSKAAADWMIVHHLAMHMDAQWAYASPRAITQEIAQAVPFYSDITWEALGDQGVQWDAAAIRPQGAFAHVEQPALPDPGDYPFCLVSGTVAYDGGRMFRMTEAMREMSFGARVGVNPSDAERLGLAEDAPVTVSSPYGSLTLAVKLTPQVRPGVVWIPESLPEAPVGVLLNGSPLTFVKLAAN